MLLQAGKGNQHGHAAIMAQCEMHHLHHHPQKRIKSRVLPRHLKRTATCMAARALPDAALDLPMQTLPKLATTITCRFCFWGGSAWLVDIARLPIYKGLTNTENTMTQYSDQGEDWAPPVPTLNEITSKCWPLRVLRPNKLRRVTAHGNSSFADLFDCKGLKPRCCPGLRV